MRTGCAFFFIAFSGIFALISQMIGIFIPNVLVGTVDLHKGRNISLHKLVESDYEHSEEEFEASKMYRTKLRRENDFKNIPNLESLNRVNNARESAFKVDRTTLANRKVRKRFQIISENITKTDKRNFTEVKRLSEYTNKNRNKDNNRRDDDRDNWSENSSEEKSSKNSDASDEHYFIVKDMENTGNKAASQKRDKLVEQKEETIQESGHVAVLEESKLIEKVEGRNREKISEESISNRESGEVKDSDSVAAADDDGDDDDSNSTDEDDDYEDEEEGKKEKDEEKSCNSDDKIRIPTVETGFGPLSSFNIGLWEAKLCSRDADAKQRKTCLEMSVSEAFHIIQTDAGYSKSDFEFNISVWSNVKLESILSAVFCVLGLAALIVSVTRCGRIKQLVPLVFSLVGLVSSGVLTLVPVARIIIVTLSLFNNASERRQTLQFGIPWSVLAFSICGTFSVTASFVLISVIWYDRKQKWRLLLKMTKRLDADIDEQLKDFNIARLYPEVGDNMEEVYCDVHIAESESAAHKTDEDDNIYIEQTAQNCSENINTDKRNVEIIEFELTELGKRH